MQLGSGGAVIPLPTAGPGKSSAGGQENLIFTAQKAVDWLIIFSLFMKNLLLSEEFLYKFKLMK